MLAHLPGPMLSIAVDQVLKVDSEDALGGLWNVFTKCKDSLADGRRLENISWRLWYRHMSAMHDEIHLSCTPPLEHSSSDSEEEEDENWEDETTVGDDEVAPPQPPQPSTSLAVRRTRHGRPISRSASPVRNRTALPPLASSHPSSSRRPTLATVRSYSSSPGRSPINVGKFISDLLPERAIPERPRRATEATPGASSSSGPASSSRALASQVPPHDTPAIADDRPQQTPQRDRVGHGTSDGIAKGIRPPAMILTKPTPRPTPQVTPGADPEPTTPGPTSSLRPSDAGMSRRRMFEFVPLQEVQAQPASPGNLRANNDALSQATQEKDNEAPKAIKQKIFFIASTPNDLSSSFSDSQSPQSDPQPPPQPPPGKPGPAPTTGPAEPSTAAEPRPALPPRTRSKRQLQTVAARTGPTKYVTAKHRVGSAARLAPLGTARPSGDKVKAGAHAPTRAMEGERVEYSGDRPKVRPTSAPTAVLVQEPEVVRLAPAERPVVLPGVGSPLVTRRKEAKAAPAPAAPTQPLAGPSSSPAVLRAPPPTPASVLARMLQVESPEVLRAPPPTPVGPNGAVLPSGPRTQRRSPPPPAPSSLEDDSDESEWYDSDAESDQSKETSEEVRAREFQQAAEEVQRQQQMFIKRRTPSRVELVQHGRVVGGLTKLFHPEPAVVDMIHLYRTKSAEGAVPGPGPSTMADRMKAHHSSADLTRRSLPSALRMSKSTVALPTLQNESVGANRSWMAKQPPDAEESDDEVDTDEPDLGMSRSLAQKKLQAFVSRASSNKSHHLVAPSNTPARAVDGPDLTAALHNVSPRVTPSSSGSTGSQQHAHFAPEPARPVEPIPLPPHPYNIPPAEVQTPRTQARRMMEDELSESMRRQLVWLRASKRRLLGGEHHLPRTRSEEEVLAHAPEPPAAYTNRVPRARGSAPPMAGAPPGPGVAGVTGVSDLPRRHAAIRPLTPMQPTRAAPPAIVPQPQIHFQIDPRLDDQQSEPDPDRKTAAALQRTRSLAEGLAHHDYHIAGW